MSDPDPRPRSIAPSAPEARRAYRLGVWNGALYQAGEGFIDAATVVPVFLSRLTHSNMLIGLATSLLQLGWLLPQCLVVPWIARMPRHLWLYRRAAVVRGIALAALAALAWPLHDRPAALLAAFLACYGVYGFAGGFAAVPFMEVVSKTIPRERLGGFWALRLFWGGLLAALAGLFVRAWLAGGATGPRYALLFGLAAVLVSVAYGLFGMIREPAGAPGIAPTTAHALLGEGLRMLRREPPFRRLLLSRVALSTWLAASPFIVLFAVRDLDGGPRAVGTFLFARVAGFVLSNLSWQALSRRSGNRAVLRAATLMASLTALAAAAIGTLSPWGLGWIQAGASVILLEAVVAAGGAAESGIQVGYASLVIELAPPDRRQAFVGLINTFVGVTSFLPALGGVVVDRLNAPALFALCSAGSLLGLRAASRLQDSRGVPPEAALGSAERPGAGGGGS